MRRFFILLSLVLLAMAGPWRAWCQDADTSDLFLNAYMANEDGEHLESAGSPARGAREIPVRGQSARPDHPRRPEVAAHRRRLPEKEGRRKYHPPRAAVGTRARAALRISGRARRGTSSEQRYHTGWAGPQRLRPAPAPPPPSEPAPPPPSEPAIPSGISGDVRAQLEELENDLRASQARLKSVENDKEDLANKLNDALNQLDSTKVSDAELKGQLKQAQDAYQNALADHAQAAEGPKALLARIAQLEEALKNAEPTATPPPS